MSGCGVILSDSEKDKAIDITLDKINSVLGYQLTKDEVIEVFNKLNFTTKEKSGKFTGKVSGYSHLRQRTNYVGALRGLCTV